MGVPILHCDQGGPLCGGDLDLHEEEASCEYLEKDLRQRTESRARVRELEFHHVASGRGVDGRKRETAQLG